MKKKKGKPINIHKIHRKRRKKIIRKRVILMYILLLSFIGTAYFMKEKIHFLYAFYFDRFEHHTLTNTPFESQRINKITEEYVDKVFGIDLSHYQHPKDIQWDSLSIGNRTIPIQFVILRATMGTRSKDQHFDEYWNRAKEHHLIRGAYHFYRPDEDPIQQANNFLETVPLENGDLVPVLDIEKKPLKYSKEKLVKNLKIWTNIIEEKSRKKNIIYTYYHYYQEYLLGEFDDHPLWLANYNDVLSPSEKDPWKMWQFTENGIVYGINTKVDINVFNGSIKSLKKLTIE